jgi:hypothetical protein
MREDSGKARIILIGCGPHAERLYLPALRKLNHLDLALVVDLKPREAEVRDAVDRKWGGDPELLFVDPFKEALPDDLHRRLSAFVHEQGIRGVIIATEPLVHRAYADWALDNGLSILLDKPISARANSTTCLASAEQILGDYVALLNKYRSLQRRQETLFTVNTQRRFHPGFQFVEEQIREIGERTGCPVTSIHSYHCDGQWRLPSEIVTQSYHPYCYGYGKASHSGYHIFDMMYRFYAAAGVRDKFADTLEIVSSFIQPNGFIRQLTEDDYRGLFGEPYGAVQRWSDDQLREIFQDYGEIDLSAIITLKKGGDAIANLSVDLIHNGFARRTWVRPGKDLYKGNGRVKHENHNIQQGPFQNIQIHSYQANDRHDEANGMEPELGGKNHFDIYVFRNPMISGETPSPRVYRLHEMISEDEMGHRSMLAIEWAKYKVVEELGDYLNGRKDRASLRSQIEDHAIPVQMMSGVYRAHILRQRLVSSVFTSSYGLTEGETGDGDRPRPGAS